MRSVTSPVGGSCRTGWSWPAGARWAPVCTPLSVDFQLLVPYLQAGPGAPLVLPFHLEARLDPGREPVPSVSRDVA